jgi:hypothetical protein
MMNDELKKERHPVVHRSSFIVNILFYDAPA